jgi:hypothetical protein
MVSFLPAGTPSLNGEFALVPLAMQRNGPPPATQAAGHSSNVASLTCAFLQASPKGTMTVGAADGSRACLAFSALLLHRGWIVLRMNLLVVFVAAAAAAGGAIAQTCNPAIDGTYCGEQMQRAPRPSAAPGARTMTGIRPGEAFSISNDDSPAMLGAITFNSDASRCIGLLRRSNCKFK